MVHRHTRFFFLFPSTEKLSFAATVYAVGLLCKVWMDTDFKEIAIPVRNIGHARVKWSSARPSIYSSSGLLDSCRMMDFRVDPMKMCMIPPLIASYNYQTIPRPDLL